MIPGGPGHRGNGRVFEELALPLLDDLYRLACRLEGDPHDAQDLVQDALLTGFRKFHQLRDPRAFRAWISSILRNTHLNRRSSTVQKLPSVPFSEHALGPPEGPSAHYEPERRLLARRLSQELRRALDRLPEDQRIAVFLIDMQGFRYGDAAEVLGVPPGTVASRVARARAALRGFLEHVARERGWAES